MRLYYCKGCGLLHPRSERKGIREHTTKISPINKLFIPTNKEGIRSGYYEHDEVLNLLRRHAGNRTKVTFIVDMME